MSTTIKAEDSAEWAELEPRSGFYDAGEVLDPGSDEPNHQPALVLGEGYVVIQGTRRAWLDLAHQITTRFTPEPY